MVLVAMVEAGGLALIVVAGPEAKRGGGGVVAGRETALVQDLLLDEGGTNGR